MLSVIGMHFRTADARSTDLDFDIRIMLQLGLWCVINEIGFHWFFYKSCSHIPTHLS